ncbi:MAG TPA: DUF2975 domain-containing protein [Marmoricola sp.]|jgi:hypothetical protein|nr:DUF2975 domain-containing protein [Marmoricola sp.]
MRQTRAASSKDLLSPLEGITRGVLVLMLAGLILSSILVLTGTGEFASFGAGSACATVNSETLPGGEFKVDTYDSPYRHARFNAQTTEVCNTKPSAWITTAASVSTLARLLFVIVALIGLQRVLRRARRDGPFTTSAATGVSRLGVLILLGSLVTELVRQVGAREVVLSVTVHDRPDVGSIFGSFDLPFTEIVVGLGLISMGRILSRAVLLQQDQDATI